MSQDVALDAAPAHLPCGDYMDPSKQYTIDDIKISHSDFDDEVVAIDLNTGNYYSFRGAAAVLWRCLAAGPASANALALTFADRPLDAAERIARFLASLESRGIVVEARDGSATGATKATADEPFGDLEFEAFEDLQALLVADIIHDTDERGWPHLAPENVSSDDGPQ